MGELRRSGYAACRSSSDTFPAYVHACSSGFVAYFGAGERLRAQERSRGSNAPRTEYRPEHTSHCSQAGLIGNLPHLPAGNDGFYTQSRQGARGTTAEQRR